VCFSPLVDCIAGEATGAWRVHQEGVRRREAGHDVIFLTVGDPDQATPEAVIDATIEALRRNCTGYSPIIGYRQGALRSPRVSSGAPADRAAPTTSF
jgi:arginine:pyruvate transaminase